MTNHNQQLQHGTINSNVKQTVGISGETTDSDINTQNANNNNEKNTNNIASLSVQNEVISPAITAHLVQSGLNANSNSNANATSQAAFSQTPINTTTSCMNNNTNVAVNGNGELQHMGNVGFNQTYNMNWNDHQQWNIKPISSLRMNDVNHNFNKPRVMSDVNTQITPRLDAFDRSYNNDTFNVDPDRNATNTTHATITSPSAPSLTPNFGERIDQNIHNSMCNRTKKRYPDARLTAPSFLCDTSNSNDHGLTHYQHQQQQRDTNSISNVHMDAVGDHGDSNNHSVIPMPLRDMQGLGQTSCVTNRGMPNMNWNSAGKRNISYGAPSDTAGSASATAYTNSNTNTSPNQFEYSANNAIGVLGQQEFFSNDNNDDEFDVVPAPPKKKLRLSCGYDKHDKRSINENSMSSLSSLKDNVKQSVDSDDDFSGGISMVGIDGMNQLPTGTDHHTSSYDMTFDCQSIGSGIGNIESGIGFGMVNDVGKCMGTYNDINWDNASCFDGFRDAHFDTSSMLLDDTSSKFYNENDEPPALPKVQGSFMMGIGFDDQ